MTPEDYKLESEMARDDFRIAFEARKNRMNVPATYYEERAEERRRIIEQKRIYDEATKNFMENLKAAGVIK